MESRTDRKFINEENHQRGIKGQDDYGDAGKLTHYFGNDEYEEGSNEPLDNYEETILVGHEAAGNNLTDEEANDS